jgi:hypothetical protein
MMALPRLFELVIAKRTFRWKKKKLSAIMIAMSGPKIMRTAFTLNPSISSIIASNAKKIKMPQVIRFFIAGEVLKKVRNSNINGASNKFTAIPKGRANHSGALKTF